MRVVVGRHLQADALVQRPLDIRSNSALPTSSSGSPVGGERRASAIRSSVVRRLSPVTTYSAFAGIFARRASTTGLRPSSSSGVSSARCPARAPVGPLPLLGGGPLRRVAGTGLRRRGGTAAGQRAAVLATGAAVAPFLPRRWCGLGADCCRPSAAQLPSGSLRGVLDDDAEGGELVADRVGAAKSLRARAACRCSRARRRGRRWRG